MSPGPEDLREVPLTADEQRGRRIDIRGVKAKRNKGYKARLPGNSDHRDRRKGWRGVWSRRELLGLERRVVMARREEGDAGVCESVSGA